MPAHGPVLLTANHPGLADCLALFATIAREDLRVVAAENPLLDALPNTSRYLISVSEASSGRLGVVRTAARHLKRDGALLTFPGGRIEPDPRCCPAPETRSSAGPRASTSSRGWCPTSRWSPPSSAACSPHRSAQPSDPGAPPPP